eukprot:GCRY01004172.1.p1 GENE.GCRY01004172.1~~GCRY01004172.1.p1  ORF type:complete len:225 (+),score=25.07 GCRY01004172.1:167-841(+)
MSKSSSCPLIVGVGGASCAGKTDFCNALKTKLSKLNIVILPLNRFYFELTPEQHVKAAKGEFNFDHPYSFNFDLVADTLNEIRGGTVAEIPEFQMSTHTRDYSKMLTIDPKVVDVVLFEGTLAFYSPIVRKQLDIQVFIDRESDSCLARRIQRSVNMGEDIQIALREYVDFVKPCYDQFIHKGRLQADFIFPRIPENQVALDVMTQYIEQRLHPHHESSQFEFE